MGRPRGGEANQLFSVYIALRRPTATENPYLFVPRPNSNFMKRTFHYSGTILWNSLPPYLKLIQDIDLFKKKISKG
jgi:hypothetical protein